MAALLLGLGLALCGAAPQTQMAALLQGQGVEDAPCLHKYEVDTLSIVMDQKPEGAVEALTVDQIKKHIGDVTQLQWVPIKEQYFSDIDGRTEERILATPGGDLGEFILAMDVYATETKTELTQEAVYDKMAEYVKSMKKSKFYWMTTENAISCLVSSAGEKFAISAPPEDKMDELMDKIIEPGHVGNDHVRWMLEDPGLYRSDRTTAELCIKAFHMMMWNRTFEGRGKLQYSLLKGEHTERAFLNIETAPACLDQGLAPVISAKGCDFSLYLYHSGAVTRFRAELATFLAKDDKKLKESLLKKMNVLGTYQLAKTGTRLIGNYPVYTAVLSQSEA